MVDAQPEDCRFHYDRTSPHRLPVDSAGCACAQFGGNNAWEKSSASNLPVNSANYAGSSISESEPSAVGVASDYMEALADSKGDLLGLWFNCVFAGSDLRFPSCHATQRTDYK